MVLGLGYVQVLVSWVSQDVVALDYSLHSTETKVDTEANMTWLYRSKVSSKLQHRLKTERSVADRVQ